MNKLKLVMGPDPIFKKKAETVSKIDQPIVHLCEGLLDMLYGENAVGIAAPMVGVLKRVIAYDLQEKGVNSPAVMINPEMIWASDETQVFGEGSVCFPGVSAKITRPRMIKVKYSDQDGAEQVMEAQGWLSSVIQHEMDYLDGKTIFDTLSPVKRKMLFKKTRKFQKET
ncbi:MAG: peptide deformylase [Kordiimonadaceae bacterium]|jgi:peptide deformylase|nr:peptide deformylase [Kordiimonadaceae bacterium]MBT6036688.1 peptide deformylase [Kordiimonadaceae bacterium]MBT6330463.1 peptide deformylase [Kordiimonadaceae bacterium]MBT7583256.1 peptide deformylase [Kordiimonadaceae bacterium]